MKREHLILLIIILFSVALRLPAFLGNYVNIDENEYAIAAQKLLAGGFPYRDVEIYQPPIIFYLYALAFWISGGVHIWAAQIIAILFVVGTIISLYLLATKVAGSKRAGLAAALAYGAFSTTFLPQDMLAANCEIIMMLPITLSVLVLFHAEKRRSLWLYLLTGIFASLGFLTKYQSGIVVAVEGAYILIISALLPLCKGEKEGVERGIIRNNILPTLFLTIGFFIPIGLLILYFYINGVLPYAKEAFEYIVLYAKGPVQSDALYVLMKFTARTALFILPGIVMWYGAAAVIAKLVCHPRESGDPVNTLDSCFRRNDNESKTPPRFIIFTSLWFFASFVPVIIGGRVYFHYYFTVLPPAATLFGIWWSERGQHIRKSVKALFVAWLFICTLGWAAYASYIPSKEPGRKDQWIYMADYLKDNTKPGESLFIWGYCPQMYIHSGLTAGTRFTTADYLTGRSPMTAGLEYDPNGTSIPSSFDKFKNDFIDPPGLVIFDTSDNIFPNAWNYLKEDFERELPVYILNTVPSNYRRYGRYPVENFPYLNDVIRKHYKPITSIRGFELYKIQNPKSQAPNRSQNPNPKE